MYFTTDVNSSAYGEVVVVTMLVVYREPGLLHKSRYRSRCYPTCWVYRWCRSPWDGSLLWLNAMDVEKEFNGVCPFHKGCLEGFGWTKPQLVQVFVNWNIELNSSVWDVPSLLYSSLRLRSMLLWLSSRMWSCLVVALWPNNTCWTVCVKNFTKLF